MGEIWCKERQGEAQRGRGGGETVLGVNTSRQSMVEFTGKESSQTENRSYTNTVNSAMELKTVYRVVSLVLGTLIQMYFFERRLITNHISKQCTQTNDTNEQGSLLRCSL